MVTPSQRTSGSRERLCLSDSEAKPNVKLLVSSSMVSMNALLMS